MGSTDDETLAWVAGLGGGFLSGVFAIWVLQLSNFDRADMALQLVLVLGTVVGVAYRTAFVTFGLVLGLLAGMWIQGLMAPLPPGGEGLFPDRDIIFPFAALFLALISYPISLVCRQLRHGRATVKPGIVAGLVALVVVSSSYVALAVWPADGSFTIDTPSGWSTYQVDDVFAGMPEVGSTYRAAQGDVGDLSLPLEPTVPMLGVSVLRQRLGNSGTYGDYNSYACFRVADTWGQPSALYLDRGADIEAPLPDAYATVVTSSSGARYYAMALSRTRWMGLIPERLCYLVVVTVPKNSTLDLAAVQSILSSFHLS